MKTKLPKSMLMTALICGTIIPVLYGGASVYAAEAEPEAVLNSFELNPMVITASRYEKKDINIGESVEIITEKDIENLGAQTALDAIQYSTNLETASYGNNGASIGNMYSRVVSRGVANGALIMVNGTPYKLRGTYDISDIPAADIERIEIIRGGGSVLYGSDAMTGVINIITKKKKKSYIEAGAGNHGSRKAAGSVQVGNFGAYYGYSRFGTLKETNSTGWDWHGPSHRSLRLNYQINDRMDISYIRDNSHTWYVTPADKNLGRARTNTYDITKSITQINYKDDRFKASAYYSDRDRDNITNTGAKNNELNKMYGGQLQYSWDFAKGKLLTGASVDHEYWRNQKQVRHERNDYAVFAQYEHFLNPNDTIVISGRETWTSGAEKNYNNFSAQGQFIHKFDENESLYLNFGTSFKLPELHAIYSELGGRPIVATGLRPQRGKHAELGYKKDLKNGRFRAALFWQDIKDNISLSGRTLATAVYVNNDLKNYGVELNYDTRLTDKLQYSTGISVSNPKTRFRNEKTGVVGEWLRAYAGFQWSNRLSYHNRKFGANLNLNFLANRYADRSNTSTVAEKIRPYLLSNLNLHYRPDDKQEIYFTCDNLLGREDIAFKSTGAEYYVAPRTFIIGYKLFF